VAWLIAIIAALAGAAATGVASWLLAEGSDRRTSEAARTFLLKNLEAVEKRLSRALESNWWPQRADSILLSAWDEYHTILRIDLRDEMFNEILKTSGDLRLLTAKGATEWAQDEQRMQDFRKASLETLPPGTSAEEAAEYDEVVQELKPVQKLADDDRVAMEKAKEQVATVRKKLGRAPSRLANRAKLYGRSAVALLGLAALATVAIWVILPATRVNFTTESLEETLSDRFPHSVVSCNQFGGGQDTWDCTIADSRLLKPETSTLLAARTVVSVITVGSTPAETIRKLIEAYIERKGTSDTYFGSVVGQVPSETDDVSRSTRSVPGVGILRLPASPVDSPDDILMGVVD
jgi:hypothetical protein